MAEDRSTQRNSKGERSLTSASEREEKLSRWVFLSCVVHALLIASLFIIPYLPAHSGRDYPVYTVDLVGGEKLGGTTLGTELKSTPPKEKPKITKPEPPPPVAEIKKEPKKEVKKEVKKEPKIPVEKKPPPEEKEVFKEPAKKEPAKKEIEKKEPVKETKSEPKREEGLPDDVREKLIQAALNRVRNRAESAQKKEKAETMTTGPAEGEGSAALGPGGRGGGIVKGIEFLIYRNRMLHLIRERWAWVGKRVELEVTVRFGIQNNGEIVGLKILQASGDPSFDDSVLRAVRKSSPLPPPPENYRTDFMDVVLTFRPKDLGG